MAYLDKLSPKHQEFFKILLKYVKSNSPCPTNKTLITKYGMSEHTIKTLKDAGYIAIILYSSNYRVIRIEKGPYKNQTTQEPHIGHIIKVITQDSAKLQSEGRKPAALEVPDWAKN